MTTLRTHEKKYALSSEHDKFETLEMKRPGYDHPEAMGENSCPRNNHFDAPDDQTI